MKNISTSEKAIWLIGMGTNVFCFSTNHALDTAETYGKVKKLLCPVIFLWDLVENDVEGKIGVQSPQQSSITTTKKKANFSTYMLKKTALFK